MFKRISDQITERNQALADHPDRPLMRPYEGAITDVDVVGVITGRQPMPASVVHHLAMADGLIE